MSKIERPIWYTDYYQDIGDKLNLSNNICFDKNLINDLNVSINLTNIHQYPDASKTYLNLGNYYNIDPKNIAIGYGAGDIVFRWLNFFKNYSIGILTPTYDLARIFAINIGMNVSTSNNVEDLNTDILYVANPNGMTGEALSKQKILKISKKYKYIIVDEAYGDFCTIDFSMLYDSIKLDNVVVIKTLSKSVAAPGLRFGYCFSNSELMYKFQNLRSSTVLTNFTHCFVPELLSLINPHVKRMLQTRDYIEENYKCKKSQGNFVLFEKNPKFSCKIKKMPSGHYRMALTDLETFKNIENE